MVRQKKTDVSETELALLRRLWDGPQTIRQLTEFLYSDGKTPTTGQYATVQKLLERLEESGHVVRERNRVPHTFAATVSRDQLIGRRLQEMAEKLCDGSLTPLLTHLVRLRPLSDGERQELRDLIELAGESAEEAEEAEEE